MPLTRIVVPPALISFAGNAVRLNRGKYPELKSVEGEPAISNKNPHYADAAHEGFVALQVARRQVPQGDRQFVYPGEPAIRFLYGGAKEEGEQDCDVVGRILQRDYGYWLAEGIRSRYPEGARSI